MDFWPIYTLHKGQWIIDPDVCDCGIPSVSSYTISSALALANCSSGCWVKWAIISTSLIQSLKDSLPFPHSIFANQLRDCHFYIGFVSQITWNLQLLCLFVILVDGSIGQSVMN